MGWLDNSLEFKMAVDDMTVSTLRMKKALILIIVMAAAFNVICIQQYRSYSNISDSLRAAIDQVSSNLTKAKKLHAQSAWLEKAVTASGRSMGIIEDQLPDTLETSKFVEMISQAAKSHSIAINNIKTSQSDFDFWQQADIMLEVSAEQVALNAWLEMITSGKRRVDSYTSTQENQNKKVTLILYAVPGLEKNPPRKVFCSTIEHTVWFRPFAARLEELQDELIEICRELQQYQTSSRNAEKNKRALARQQKNLAILHEIERKHTIRLSNRLE